MGKLPGGLTAVVTGASSGIGREVALDLAQRGVAQLVLVARRTDRLEAVANEVGSIARVRTVDLGDPSQVTQLVQDEPIVDILVNNAGFGYGVPFEEQDPNRLLQMVDVNCRALLQLTAAWLPGMIERQRGWILNVGSTAGLFPTPSMAVYGATKAYVNSFTEALRAELRDTGVRVHLLAPGPVATEFFDVARPGTKRPPEFLFLGADQVARDSLDALFADQPRLIPGLFVRLGTGLLATLPMPLFRPLSQEVVPRIRQMLTRGN